MQSSDSKASIYGSNAWEKLSDGLRKLATEKFGGLTVDSSDLSLSSPQRVHQRNLCEAIGNVNDGISLLHMARRGLEALEQVLLAMRELAIESASENSTDYERGDLDQELIKLTAKFEQIITSTAFNDIRLLDGSSSHIELDIGINTTKKMELEIAPLASDSSHLSLGELFSTGIVSRSAALNALNSLDMALNAVDAKQGLIPSSLDTLEGVIGDISSRNQRIQDSIASTSSLEIALVISLATKEKLTQSILSAYVIQAVRVDPTSSTLLSL